ncbi:anti-sigma factor antagonist [Nocardia araoensis]|uniref:anti-sigma factor antagonist n=1 Tax=Nocardia araoensis TaxID=228600 RepID=UPI000685F47C|nr:anti-sigma factor antagonist [Nocardia araoensis]
MSTESHGLGGAAQPPSDGWKDPLLGLDATIEHRGDATIVHVNGEVDAYTQPAWRRILREAGATTAAPGSMVLDAGGLGFMSCRSLVILAEEAEACLRRGVRLRVVGDRLVVGRVVAVLDLGALRPVHTSVEDALADSPPSGRFHGLGPRAAWRGHAGKAEPQVL